jgi:peptidoglycan hydrolase-like protein with peptidoglycan-binding domain
MKLQGRNLVPRNEGKDVHDLQRDLVWLGFEILSDEITSARFGETTRAAVQNLQKQNNHVADSVVGPKTVALINSKLVSMQRNARGNVLTNRGPVAKAVVRLFDKDLRKETKLGEAITGSEGYFEIRYTTSDKSTIAPNLILKAFASPRDTKPIATSTVIFGADPQVIINLVVGESEFRGLSDFELLIKDIKPVVDAQRIKIGQLVEDKNAQDVTFLSNQIGHSADRLAQAVLAHRLSEKTEAAPGSGSDSKPRVDPEVFYAWFRQGLPTEVSALLSQDPGILRRALIQAVAENVIPQGFETEDRLNAAMEGLEELRASLALKTPLGDLVKGVLREEPLQLRFMRAYAKHSGSLDEFWKNLEGDEQLGDSAAELKFAVVLGNIGENHPPLVEAVRRTPGLNELKDLAELNEERWIALLTERSVGTPTGIEGANDGEKTRNYARSLTRAVEAAVPTEFFVARLKETNLDGRDDLLKFFQANTDFDIKNTRLDTFLKSNTDALNSLNDKTVKQLKDLQRVYRLAPSFEPANALHRAGKNSGHDIARMGQNAFVSSFGPHFGDATLAKAVYAKAQQVSAGAVALLGDVNPSMGRVGLAAVPDQVANTVREIPNWSTLFGALDFCSCGQCQSVHSPAAYLVDLLNFLGDRAAKFSDPLPSVKDILFTRRADLGDIELTCENTNTPMPYVDLVLEVLEDAVAPPVSFDPFDLDRNRIADLDKGQVSDELKADFPPNALDNATIRVKRPGESWVIDALDFSYSVHLQENGKPKVQTRNRQTSGTQQERAANPQYVNLKAYDEDHLKKAVFPWRLPFDQLLEEARAYLGHLGVPRHQIVEAFMSDDRRSVLSNPDLAAEYLGLGRSEVELIFGADPTEPWLQWGFEVEGQWLDTIAKVDEFLRRSGLEYRELLYLLQTRYVNSGNDLTIEPTDANQPDTCDTSKLKLRDLNAALANRIVRFVRLWRKLGWTIFDLDRVISVFDSEFTVEFLVQLSHLARLRKRFNVPVVRLAAFWGLLDIVRYTNEGAADRPLWPSLYDQLFRSRENINPLDSVFTEDPDKLAGTLAQHAEAIAAALKLGAADFDAILQNQKIFPPEVEKLLKLENLSHFYRHATLARSLRFQVEDYLRAIELIDVAPFTGKDTAATMLFVESVIQIKESEFSFAELDYLLRHQGEVPSGIAIEDRVIVERLQDVGQELQKGAAKEAIARKLAETFGFEMGTVSLLEPQWISLTDPTFSDAIKDILAKLVDPTLGAPLKALTRADFPRQFEDMVRLHKISVIAARFNLKADMLDWLLEHGAAQGLFDLKTLPIAPNNSDFPKWMRLVNLLRLRPTFSRGESGLLELLELAHQTPAPATDQLIDKLVEQTNWSRTDLEFLVGPIGFTVTPGDLKDEKVLVQLTDTFALLKRLGMSAAQAKNLSAPDVTSDMAQAVRQSVRGKYDDAQWLKIAKPLRDVLREKQRSALVDYLVAHFEVPLPQLQTPHPDLSINDRGPAVRELQQKLNALGANPRLAVNGQFDRETQDAVEEFQNRIGISDHSLVEISTWTELDKVRRSLRDANELYAYFLIDVEMAPCMMTSRIKQAISSVQLFVQRCLMNLEQDEVSISSETDDAWDWWKWMKNYRVWEANRKVFLYPENWIEPELRDDKSPFFKELESELMESDLTLETAETAFLNYVEKLDHVARLEVMGVYHQKDSELDLLHVFARDQAPPHAYYYRQRVNGAYWTPWEKVDVDIEGNHLIPILWNGRLFLFWPMFIEKSANASVKVPPLSQGGSLTNETKKFWEMKLAWSERKQGKWAGKKVSSQSAKIFRAVGPRDNELADLSKVFFFPEVNGSDLSIDQLFVTTEVGPGTGLFLARNANDVDFNPFDPLVVDPDPPVNGNDGFSPTGPVYIAASLNLFFFGGCYVDPQIKPHGAGPPGTGQNVLFGTRRSNMSFQEIEESPLNLPVHSSLGNSQAALAQTPGQYRVITQGADPRVTRNPFFFQDPSHSYLVTPRLSPENTSIDPGEVGGAVTARLVPGSNFADIRPGVVLDPNNHGPSPFFKRPNTKYSFHAFYHPYVCPLISILNRQGLDEMLRREVQLHPEDFLPSSQAGVPISFQKIYAPNDLVAQPYPTEEMDFSFSGSYSSYNWELFFHAPLLIADRLTKNQRFEEAAKWFHYIFNPTDASDQPAPQRYWQTREFFEKTSEEYQQERLDNLFNLLAGATELRQKPTPTPQEQKDLQRLEDLEASIKAWRDYPFSPHLVARMRTTAYQKAVVMKYIDNLIAWGDQLFRRDTLETLNQATQLYVLAADILGTRPVEVTARVTPRVQTYRSLEPRLEDFANALIEVEELVPVDKDPSGNVPEQQPPLMLYFCLPKNEKLLGYWDTVADRLFKLRHCMNIEGVVRQLPLFEPPIDPALLVRGTAAGLDLTSLLNDFADSALPTYRFNVLSQKASELCGELKSLSANLLATLEKRDAEQLSLVRAKHERGLLEMIEQVREKQLEEASASVVTLQKSRDMVVSRYLHYQKLLGVEDPVAPPVDQVVPEITASPLAKISVLDGLKQIDHETAEMSFLEAASRARVKASLASLIATHFSQIPDVSSEPMGVGAVFALRTYPSERALMFGADAEISTYQAGKSSRNAQFVMRAHEWTLQNNLAAREIMQIDKQIVAAEIRREIAEHELQNHRKQMENALEVEEFMRQKYTNRELYSWMVGQMSGVYFQAYQLAYEMAKRTELCFRHELGITESTFIRFGYWDSLKKGLMAGEKLHHDLKRMEVAYLDRNTREYELTKHVSLVSLDPKAFITLKEQGNCEFRIPEWLFDLDTPGHFMRRLKMVSVTIPCVTGPYTTIHCKLQLLNNSYRKNADLPGEYDRKPKLNDSPPDSRFIDDLKVVGTMVTSTAQNDSGLFEPNMRDERYLPFEGAGAISRWQLELPMQFKSFDYSTISDVILHLRYTARDGGDELGKAATTSAQGLLKNEDDVPLFRLISVRHEFPTEWHRFVSSPDDPTVPNAMTLDIAPTRFPYFVQNLSIAIKKASVIVRTQPASSPKVGIAFGPSPPNFQSTEGPQEVDGSVGLWTWVTDARRSEIKDVFLIIEYNVARPNS